MHPGILFDGAGIKLAYFLAEENKMSHR